MEAEEKAGRQEHLSKTVRLILDKCRTSGGNKGSNPAECSQRIQRNHQKDLEPDG